MPVGFRIGVFGGEGVGKTSLLRRFLGGNDAFLSNDDFSSYTPTFENWVTKYGTIDDLVIKNLHYTLQILDTAGQERYASLRDDWIWQSDGVVLVYDVTSPDSFKNIQNLIEKVICVKQWDLEGSRPSKLPIMIVGNKIDRREKQTVQTTDGKDLAMNNGCEFIEASAMNSTNVTKAFHDVVRILFSFPQGSDAQYCASLPGAPRSPPTKLIDGGCCAVM
ncbi:putative small G-protein Ras2 [Astrocystis sublimbata]|nr:putative small G-protein Ras2 [Astrocystis sublimbata]